MPQNDQPNALGANGNCFFFGGIVYFEKPNISDKSDFTRKSFYLYSQYVLSLHMLFVSKNLIRLKFISLSELH